MAETSGRTPVDWRRTVHSGVAEGPWCAHDTADSMRLWL